MRLFFISILLFFTISGLSQATNPSLNEDYYHRIDRYEIKSGKIANVIFTAIKPYQRDAVVEYLNEMDSLGVFTSRKDQFNRSYLNNDSWEFGRPDSRLSQHPLWKSLYKTTSDFLHVDKKDFDLHVNPVLYTSFGKDGGRESVYTNTRGIEIRGLIDKKIGFYTFFFDNQSRQAFYVQNSMQPYPVIPHEGFWKEFKNNGTDFLQARAYISFKASKHVDIQFGHDRNFIGNGYRSLILSDFSSPNLFIRANASVWKVNYLFQLNRLTADVDGTLSGTTANVRYPQKFFAFHHASINIGKRLNLGVFESVIFSPRDTLKTNYFDFGYLNPIIFYRAIEQQFGSADNVILGADFKWIPVKTISLYGQFILDEFSLQHIRASDGWWANKFGIQAGFKWIDVGGISNLDIQLEGNLVRPYTYSHGTLYGSYSNYLQPLAHPLGANFREINGILRYQLIPQLTIAIKTFVAVTGKDSNGANWGGDIIKRNNQSRPRELGNIIGQGVKTRIMFGDFTLSWMVKHNFFIDFKQIFRKSVSDVSSYSGNTSLTSLALRLNIAQRQYEF